MEGEHSCQSQRRSLRSVNWQDACRTGVIGARRRDRVSHDQQAPRTICAIPERNASDPHEMIESRKHLYAQACTFGMILEDA